MSRHWIQKMQDASFPDPQAGLSALAHYSMLAEPGNVTIALSREDWKSLRQKDTVKKAMADEPGAVTVEVWGYPPLLFASDGCVDRLSLYLSLRDLKDERVEAALNRMLMEVSW